MNTATLYLEEDQLARILYHLPKDDPMRNYLQEAGYNMFGW